MEQRVIAKTNMSRVYAINSNEVMKLGSPETIIRDFAMASRVRGPGIVDYRQIETVNRPCDMQVLVETIANSAPFSRVLGIRMKRYKMDLARYLDLWPSPSDRVVQGIANRMIDCLARVHAAGILHCDIKLANFLVQCDSDGNISDLVLTDFGLAQLIGESKSNRIQTPDHHAPELVYNDTLPVNYGIEVDMWSLGVALFALLSGRDLWQKRADRLDCTRYNLVEFLEGIPEHGAPLSEVTLIPNYGDFAKVHRENFKSAIFSALLMCSPNHGELCGTTACLLDLDPAKRPNWDTPATCRVLRNPVHYYGGIMVAQLMDSIIGEIPGKTNIMRIALDSFDDDFSEFSLFGPSRISVIAAVMIAASCTNYTLEAYRANNRAPVKFFEACETMQVLAEVSRILAKRNANCGAANAPSL